jgi:heterodisulfide reductase subunit A-like polyferredoxin
MYSSSRLNFYGALPMADVTLINIVIRAFGKGYDEFSKKQDMGVKFVKEKSAKYLNCPM